MHCLICEIIQESSIKINAKWQLMLEIILKFQINLTVLKDKLDLKRIANIYFAVDLLYLLSLIICLL